MKDRLKQVRKEAKLNQTVFGESIGATQFMVTSYETGRVTPDDTTIKLICSIYNVNEDWLKTGEGEPYKRQVIPELARILRNNPALYELLSACIDKLTDDDWKIINTTVAKIVNKKDSP